MDESAKKHALRMIPYANYLVGVREKHVQDASKDLNAFLGSWVTQTSFKPPMVAVAVKKDGRSFAMVRDSRVLALSILGRGQKHVGQTFFKDLHVHAEDAHGGTMSGVRYHVEPKTGCPVFPDLPGWLACEVVDVLDRENDHALFLAKVVDAHYRGPAEPLAREETGWVYGG